MAEAALAVASSPGGSSVMPSTIASFFDCAKAAWGKASGNEPSAAVVRRVRRFNMSGTPAQELEKVLDEEMATATVHHLKAHWLGGWHGRQQGLRVRVLGLREKPRRRPALHHQAAM